MLSNAWYDTQMHPYLLFENDLRAFRANFSSRLSRPRLKRPAFALAVDGTDHAVAVFVGTHIGDHFACLRVVGQAKRPE